jgi:NAD dependent epimerase/dehydratase family enzyme
MSSPVCSCEKFDRLEGASVGAYVAAFLEDLGRDDPKQKNRFHCRVCGRQWEKRAPETQTGSTRPSLIRKSEQ